MVTPELNDIQGNILHAYNFPAGVYSFVRVPDAERGRGLLREILPEISDAREWRERPPIATNVAVTYAGLQALGVDESVLETLPAAFRGRVIDRACALGDVGPSDPAQWDKRIGSSTSAVALGSGEAHILVLVAAGRRDEDEPLNEAVTRLDERLKRSGSECIHRQPVRALDGQREHFGYADGFGQPAIEGVSRNWPGQGTALLEQRAWRDIKAGEFILGYPDEEADCLSGEAAWLLRNGSFMVYRKLRQDVALFRRRLSEQASRYAQTAGVPSEGSFELLAAKLVGRWRDGNAIELDQRLDRPGDLQTRFHRRVDNDFRYGEDRQGLICPRGAHIRRANPRDLLGPDGTAARRHRIIRRGMPYGEPYPEGEEAQAHDAGDRGLIFMCFNADLERQFEVIQGQWCNDGNAFGLGSDQDYLLGNRSSKVIIEGDPPFLVSNEPGLVVTRGCEYLLMPGLAALYRLCTTPSRQQSDLEAVPDDESDAITEIVELVRQEMRRNYASSRPVRRGQHPKSNGCVKGKFIVGDVPPDLRHGLFEQPGEYDAWIRFSGSHATLQSDAKRDAHGMAIKVIGLPGHKVVHEDRRASTQDFVLVNHDVFFCRDANECAHFAKVVTATGSLPPGPVSKLRVLRFYLPLNPVRWRLRGLLNLVATISTRIKNPLAVRYWSQTPYALGPYAVKYSVRPQTTLRRRAHKAQKTQKYDSLEEVVAATLRPANARFVFDFLVQRQADPSSMPVEDPTVRWSERDSAFRRVATILINHQDEDVMSQRRRNWSENLSFTPWNTSWAHRPLGGINRVRRAVYRASSELRHELDGAPHFEPRSNA